MVAEDDPTVIKAVQLEGGESYHTSNQIRQRSNIVDPGVPAVQLSRIGGIAAG